MNRGQQNIHLDERAQHWHSRTDSGQKQLNRTEKDKHKNIKDKHNKTWTNKDNRAHKQKGK